MKKGLFIVIFLLLVTSLSFSSQNPDLRTEIEKFALNSLGLPKEKVEISYSQVPQVEIPLNSEIKVISLSQNRPIGLVPLKVEIWQNQNLFNKFNTSVEVRVFNEVLVACRNLKSFEEITFQDVKKERREVTNFLDKYFSDVSELSGYRAKRNIPLGRIIGRDAVEEMPLIKKGDKVKILVFSGNVVLTSLGTAREDGKFGASIKITDNHTNKIVSALVLDKKTVKIELDSN